MLLIYSQGIHRGRTWKASMVSKQRFTHVDTDPPADYNYISVYVTEVADAD